MSLKDFINQHQELKESKELVFFGGSFNPWHEGHTSCLTLAPDRHPIIVIPDHNPFKDFVGTTHKKSSVAEIRHELGTIKSKTFLFDEFLLEDKKNPSHVWISQVKEDFPDKDISLLMGFDTYISIDRWINAYDVINKLSTLYVASRLDDEKLKLEQLANLKRINPRLKIKFIGNHEYEELSSSIIRNAMKNKK